MKTNKIPVGFRMNENLVRKVDEYAEAMGINRSSAICCILSMYFESKENIEVLQNIAALVKQEGAEAVGTR